MKSENIEFCGNTWSKLENSQGWAEQVNVEKSGREETPAEPELFFSARGSKRLEAALRGEWQPNC